MKHVLNQFCDKIFVISIDRFGRKDNMRERLSGVEFEFFNGVDGSLVSEEEYGLYQMRRLPGSHNLSRGMYGCAMSHLNLYKKIVSDGLNNVLILEDDVWMTNAVYNLGNYFDQMPGYDLVYFGLNNGNTDFEKILVPPSGKNVVGVTADMIRHNRWLTLEGTNAYFIRSNEYLKGLIEFQEKWMYTSDGALIEYLLHTGGVYHVFNPQVFPAEKNQKSIILNTI